MPKHETRTALEHHSHHVKKSLLCLRVLYTHLLKDCFVMKTNLNNYDSFKDNKKSHIKYQKHLRTSGNKKQDYV